MNGYFEDPTGEGDEFFGSSLQQTTEKSLVIEGSGRIENLYYSEEAIDEDVGEIYTYTHGNAFLTGVDWNSSIDETLYYNQYRGGVTELIICEGITGAEYHSFNYFQSLSKITLPSTFTNVGDQFDYTTPNPIIYVSNSTLAEIITSSITGSNYVYSNPTVQIGQ